MNVGDDVLGDDPTVNRLQAIVGILLALNNSLIFQIAEM